MLKELISLFSDSFIKNKSEWIGRQAYPSRRVNLSTDLSEYVPPADGYLGFYKPDGNSSYSVDVYSYGTDGGIVSRKTLGISASAGVFTFSGIVPVKKGYRIVIYGTFTELWFSPSVGSKY